MGILDITDNFCKTIDQDSIRTLVNADMKMSNRMHEQPIVTFIEKESEQEVIYREEM